MAKKRKSRYTPEEQTLHKEAVRLRNMTGKQLVEEFHRSADPGIITSARQRPQESSEAEGATGDTSAVQRLLDALARGECRGIKGGIAHKVAQFAAERGLI